MFNNSNFDARYTQVRSVTGNEALQVDALGEQREIVAGDPAATERASSIPGTVHIRNELKAVIYNTLIKSTDIAVGRTSELTGFELSPASIGLRKHAGG